MGRTDLINYILENGEQFTMEELVFYTYTELVMIKTRVELEKIEKGEPKTKNSRSNKRD